MNVRETGIVWIRRLSDLHLNYFIYNDPGLNEILVLFVQDKFRNHGYDPLRLHRSDPHDEVGRKTIVINLKDL